MTKSRTIYRKTKAWALAAAVLAATAAFCVLASNGCSLALRDAGSGVLIAAFPASPGDSFSVSFVHSVNNSSVADVYEIKKDGIYLIETKYYSFGAGVPTEVEPGQSLSYAEDGAMVISGISRKIPDLIYVVGTVSDHVLAIGGEDVGLRELCGRNRSVRFSVEAAFGRP